MKIYEKDVKDKQEQEKIAPVVIPEAETVEVIEAKEDAVPVPVEEKFVIKVGDLWFKLLTPFTLVENKEDAAVLDADKARAQAYRILRIKKLQNEIVSV